MISQFTPRPVDHFGCVNLTESKQSDLGHHPWEHRSVLLRANIGSCGVLLNEIGS